MPGSHRYGFDCQGGSCGIPTAGRAGYDQRITPLKAIAHSRLSRFLQSACRPAPAATLTAAFSFAICYLRSFVFPNIPIALWGDQVGFFNDGSRMILGQLPYRDYFQIVPPATDLIYALMIKCFGLRMWVPNLLMAGLAAITALLMTLIASRLVRGAIVMLPAFLLTGIILVPSMEATHHWFSTVALLSAMLVLLGGTALPHVAVAGGLCGIAACFTQTKGAVVVACLAAYLTSTHGKHTVESKHWRQGLLLCGVAAAVFVCLNAYFIRAAGLGDWLFCIVVYPLRYYPAPAINNWQVLIYDFGGHSGITKWISLPFIYATVPFVYVLVMVIARREWNGDQEKQWRRLFLVMTVGIAMLLAVAPSPSVKRLATVSPPALVLLAWLLDRPGKIASVVKLALAGAAIALAIGVSVRIQTKWHACLDLPSGRTAFLDPPLYEEYRWLVGATRPGQYFFGLPPLYYAFHMRNPAAIEGFHPSEYTRPRQVVALIEALESYCVPLIVIRQSRDFLAVRASPRDPLTPFRIYLTRNYQLTKTFVTGDDVWRRIEAASPSSSTNKSAAEAESQMARHKAEMRAFDP